MGTDEENPDHAMIAKGVEAACWMAGRAHDYPEQFAAGLRPKAVKEKYYYARRPEITRPWWTSAVSSIPKVEANRANQAKGPAGHHGSQNRAELRQKEPASAAPGRRRRDGRPQLRQGVRPLAQPGARAEVRRRIRRGVPLHRAGDAEPVEDYIRKHAVPAR